MFNPGIQIPFKFSLVFILTMSLFQSCTVQKRHYRKGFYVHHSGKVHENKKQTTSTWQVVVANSNAAARQPEPDPTVSIQKSDSSKHLASGAAPAFGFKKENRGRTKKQILAGVKELCSNHSDYITQSKQLKLLNRNVGKDEPSPKAEKEFLSSAFISFMLSLVNYLFLLVGIFAVALGLTTQGLFIILFSIFIAILSIVLAAIAVSRKISDKEKYYGVGFAIAGAILSMLLLVFLFMLFSSFL